MMYIQLAHPYKDYDKVRVTAAHFTKDKNGDRLNFRYEIYKKDGTEMITLFDRIINITDQDAINDLALATPQEALSIWDNMTKRMLQRLIDTSTELGTLEVE